MPLSKWSPSALPHRSREGLAAQVLLLIRDALLSKSAPVHDLSPEHVVVCEEGSVLIDSVGYLSKHFWRGDSLVGECDKAVFRFCLSFVRSHLEGSAATDVSSLLTSRWKREPVACLTAAAQSLCAQNARRTVPLRMSLSEGFFTLKEYTSEIPTWIPERSADAGHRPANGVEGAPRARLLVYGTPPSARGDQAREPPATGEGWFRPQLGNLLYRLKSKVFRDARVEVAALDCTHAPIRVTLGIAALRGIPGVDDLDVQKLPFCEQGRCYIHDADLRNARPLKWTPAIMFSKHRRTSPIPGVCTEYYKIVVLIVSLCYRDAQYISLIDLFRDVTPVCGTDYSF